VRIVSLFVAQGSFYPLFVFDAFNGNFSDDENNNDNNDILPKPFQGCSQT
jgi:hypothetical protein